MALGLKYGREDVSDSAAKANTYAKVESLLQVFKDKYGIVVCRDLIGCDFLTPEAVGFSGVSTMTHVAVMTWPFALMPSKADDGAG